MSNSPPAASAVHGSSRHGTYVDADGTPLRADRAPGFAVRALLFLLIFAALLFAWNASRGGAIERWVIDDVTVRPAAWLVNLLTPEVQAYARGTTLAAPGGGLNILNGCEGIDALFLLVTAFLVAPFALRDRIPGLLLGVALLYVVNQARILLLFYAWRRDPALFAALHGSVMPIVVVLAVAGWFYGWLRSFPPRPAAAA